MALVSREVASYPMQGAVERPPAPTLSPLPNPFLCLRLPDFLSLSLSLASRFSASPLLRPGHISVTLACRFLSLQRPPLRSLARSSVRPSKPGQLPSVFLRSRMRRITGIPPSKPKVVPSRRAFPFPPPPHTRAAIFHAQLYGVSNGCVHEILVDDRSSIFSKFTIRIINK